MSGLTRIRVRNCRALAAVDLEVGPINVVCGPNGAGKSTLLDTLCFFRDCAIRGVESASSERGHSIGILRDGAGADQDIEVELTAGGVTFNPGDAEAGSLDRLLHHVRRYRSRSFRLSRLKKSGSESSHETLLSDPGSNAWSVLRNLQDKQRIDPRHGTIMRCMSEAFPTFDRIALEQTGPGSVYASFLEKGRREGILASEVSDGHLQLLLLLIALFSEGERESVLVFDEPETSLHPWAIAVFAKAVKEAVGQWNKQVFLATHSPVLISQFEPQDILVASIEEGRARFDRLSEIKEVQDLLEEYAAGSLYMSRTIAPQSLELTRA